jgi:hypothetical protein
MWSNDWACVDNFGPVSAKRPGTNGHYYQVFTAAVVDDNFTIFLPNLSHD